MVANLAIFPKTERPDSPQLCHGTLKKQAKQEIKCFLDGKRHGSSEQDDAPGQSNSIVGVNQTTTRLRSMWPPPLVVGTT